MFGFIKKMFIRLFISTVNDSNHTKCIPINNQQCILLTNLFHILTNTVKDYVNLDRYVGSCNTLNDLSKRICVPNKKKKRFEPECF